MGYGVQFHAHQGSGPKNIWDFRGYGLWQAWVMRVPTVAPSPLSIKFCQISKKSMYGNTVLSKFKMPAA